MSRFVSRRCFVRGAAAASALALLPAGRLAAQVRFGSDPFQLGVASGDPAPDGFVLWTRLLPEPHEPRQLGQVVFEVDWEVAEDASFTRIVKAGRDLAPPHLAHSVHAEVTGLGPGGCRLCVAHGTRSLIRTNPRRPATGRQPIADAAELQLVEERLDLVPVVLVGGARLPLELDRHVGPDRDQVLAQQGHLVAGG